MNIPALHLGIRHPMVAKIKNFLLARKLYAGTSNMVFDAELDLAVRTYQKAHGLVVDGWIGNRTLAAMMQEGLAVMDTTYDKDFPPVPKNLTPLTSNNERMKRLGSYRYQAAPEKDNREAIRILGDWEEQNISTFVIPQLLTLGLHKTGRVRLHKCLVERTLGLWAAWEKEGLLPLVLSWDGGFVPRFIRGSSTVLSNHAFGSAFDINYEWNQLGHVPAYPGERGSVRELVPIANQFGFYWGGHFSSRPDGMHFEAAAEALT